MCQAYIPDDEEVCHVGHWELCEECNGQFENGTLDEFVLAPIGHFYRHGQLQPA
jgi:hypothetical protein